MYDVVIVGAGAAGMVASWRAAKRGLKVLLVEKNTKLGVKILMSGGTRCNITQDTDRKGIVQAFGNNGKFLNSSLASFGPAEVVDMFNRLGVPTKVESTGKIFPQSDRAIDVRDALVRQCRDQGVEVLNPSPVKAIRKSPQGFEVESESETFQARGVAITTGGKSYPGCGTVGDGYAWAEQFGHQIVPTLPALCPISSGEKWVSELSGMSLLDANVSILDERGKVLGENRNPVLFTHFGLSGPAPMNVSRFVELYRDQKLKIQIDCDPQNNSEQLRRQFEQLVLENGAKAVGALNLCSVPRSYWESILHRSEVEPKTRLAELGKKKFNSILERIKRTQISVGGTRGFPKAEVTAGGVSLNEVNSSTMESKLQPGLFFAGEILDLDGPIGGYNFQAAFATGYLAGENMLSNRKG